MKKETYTANYNCKYPKCNGKITLVEVYASGQHWGECNQCGKKNRIAVYPVRGDDPVGHSSRIGPIKQYPKKIVIRCTEAQKEKAKNHPLGEANYIRFLIDSDDGNML